MFGGEAELFGAAADAGQRLDNLAFFGSRVIAEGIDGIAQRADFGERNLEDVGELGRAVARRLCRHVKRHRHLPGEAGKFWQIFKGDAKAATGGGDFGDRFRHHAELYRQLFHLRGELRHCFRRGIDGFFHARHRRFKLHRLMHHTCQTTPSGDNVFQTSYHLAEPSGAVLRRLPDFSQLTTQFSDSLAMQCCRTCQFFFGKRTALAQLLQCVVKLRNFLARPVVGVKADGDARAFKGGQLMADAA